MKKPTYLEWYSMAETAIRHYESYKFFQDGAAREAALAAVLAQEKGCSAEATLSEFCRVFESKGHVCYFDDPCDAWAA
jgi:hypothetical protein